MRTKWITAALLAVLFACPVVKAQDPAPYEVQKGDTLWDLSGDMWNDPFTWPKMWSMNPQIHNPHWIYPGDMLFFKAEKKAPEPKVREVRLMVEKLTPPEPVKEVEEVAVVEEDKGIKLIERRAQDFMSAERPARLGTVRNYREWKHMTAEEEHFEFVPAEGATLKEGDRVTLFNDERFLRHPENGSPLGYHVKVVGQGEITHVEGDTAWAKVLKSYGELSQGDGVMAYREPVARVVPVGTPKGIEGMVVAGDQPTVMHTSDDIVFLDRGSEDGLVSGAEVVVPYPKGPTVAEGYTDDIAKPIARVLVISTESHTATGLITYCSRAVEAGFRFVASADSP